MSFSPEIQQVQFDQGLSDDLRVGYQPRLQIVAEAYVSIHIWNKRAIQIDVDDRQNSFVAGYNPKQQFVRLFQRKDKDPDDRVHIIQVHVPYDLYHLDLTLRGDSVLESDACPYVTSLKIGDKTEAECKTHHLFAMLLGESKSTIDLVSWKKSPDNKLVLPSAFVSSAGGIHQLKGNCMNATVYPLRGSLVHHDGKIQNHLKIIDIDSDHRGLFLTPPTYRKRSQIQIPAEKEGNGKRLLSEVSAFFRRIAPSCAP